MTPFLDSFRFADNSPTEKSYLSLSVMATLRQLGSRRETHSLGRDIPESRTSNPAH